MRTDRLRDLGQAMIEEVAVWLPDLIGDVVPGRDVTTSTISISGLRSASSQGRGHGLLMATGAQPNGPRLGQLRRRSPDQQRATCGSGEAPLMFTRQTPGIPDPPPPGAPANQRPERLSHRGDVCLDAGPGLKASTKQRQLQLATILRALVTGKKFASNPAGENAFRGALVQYQPLDP